MRRQNERFEEDTKGASERKDSRRAMRFTEDGSLILASLDEILDQELAGRSENATSVGNVVDSFVSEIVPLMI